MSSRSLVEISVDVFDPARKIKADLEFINLLLILKNYPAELTMHILDLQQKYDYTFTIGQIFSDKYYSTAIDKLTIESELRLLKMEYKKLQEQIKFDNEV